MGAKYRRRRLVVDPSLQSRIIAAISWPAAVSLAVTAILLGLFCAKVTEQALAKDVQLDGVFTMLVTCLSFIVVSTVYFLFNSLKVSHRVAGPIHRMRVTLQQVRKGDPSLRAHIRKNDFLHELASEINEFLDWAEEHLPSAPAAETVAADPAVAGAVDAAPSLTSPAQTGARTTPAVELAVAGAEATSPKSN